MTVAKSVRQRAGDLPRFTHSIDVRTMFNDNRIVQEVYETFDRDSRLLIRHVLDLQEAGARDALIKLGWTPPALVSPQGDPK